MERLLLQNKVTEAIQLVETVVQTDLREDAVKVSLFLVRFQSPRNFRMSTN